MQCQMPISFSYNMVYQILFGHHFGLTLPENISSILFPQYTWQQFKLDNDQLWYFYYEIPRNFQHMLWSYIPIFSIKNLLTVVSSFSITLSNCMCSIPGSWFLGIITGPRIECFTYLSIPYFQWQAGSRGTAYLVCGTFFDGAWLRLTRSSQGIREEMHSALMEVALEWKCDVESYILHSWDSRGLLIYCLWVCTLTLLKKSACYKLCSPLL